MLALALFTLLPSLAAALPCVQFDTSWNLYAFGGSSDVKLGANSSWASPSPTTLSSSGRPPWTGNSTQCLLSQYNNAMYVLGGDASDLSKIYIYNFAADSWSTQSTSSAPTNLGNSRSASVLDHDTNVIFTLASGSGASLYQLDMSAVTNAASSSALGWEAVSNPSFTVDGYTPTAAQASNHINYFGVPGTAAGSADLFVVHYAYFQPDAQSYPTQNGGATFPDQAGQAFSIPDSQNNVPYQMVFVPNDFSSSYVVTHWTDPSNYATTNTSPFSSTSLINSTQILPAPSSKDTNSAYAASDTSLVQIDSNGDIYYITNAVSSYQVSSSATWTKMSYSLSGVTGGSGSASSNSSTTSTSAASGTSSGTAASTGSKSGSTVASGTGSAGTAAATTSKAAAGLRAEVGSGKWNVVGVTVGLVMLGAAAVL